MTFPLTSTFGNAGEQHRDGVRSLPGPRTVSVTLYTQPDRHLIQAWDRLVSETPGSDVWQLSGRANLRPDGGFLPLYLLARYDDQLVGGAMVLQRHLPVLGVVGYLPYGAVIAPHAPRSAVVHALCAELADLGHTRLGNLFVQPPEGGDDVGDQLRERGFRPWPAGTGPQGVDPDRAPRWRCGTR